MMAKLPWDKLPAAARGPLSELKHIAESFVGSYWARVLGQFPITSTLLFWSDFIRQQWWAVFFVHSLPSVLVLLALREPFF